MHTQRLKPKGFALHVYSERWGVYLFGFIIGKWFDFGWYPNKVNTGLCIFIPCRVNAPGRLLPHIRLYHQYQEKDTWKTLDGVGATNTTQISVPTLPLKPGQKIKVTKED